MFGRPPQPDAGAKRVDDAYAMMKGAPAGAAPEPQEDELLQELEEALSRASAVLEKLRGAQGAEKSAAGPEDTGSPSAQGMP